MSDNELPTVASKDAVCHIDFEFQMPYHEPLTSKELLEECISNATTEVLSTIRSSNGQILTLSTEAIEIPEIDLRPNDTNPKRIKVGGWITCNDNLRQIYMDSLQLAQQSRKISKQIANKTSVKRTKIQIQQFTTRFSNAHHVNKSFIDSTVKQFNEFKRRSNSLLSNNDDNEEQKNNDDTTNNDTPPNLYDNSSVIVHDDDDNENDTSNNDMTNNNTNDEDEEEYDLVSKQSTNDTSNDIDSSFQLVDAQYTNDADEQSSNEEHKSPIAEDNDTGTEDNNTDYTSITPIMPSITPENEDVELLRLRLEITKLKGKHRDELDHFQNKVNTLKDKIKQENQDRTIERQRSRISMQIDDDIFKKQIQKQTDTQVEKLQSEIKLKEKEQNINLQQLQLKHQTELQKFDYKLRQTQQLHSLEITNIRNQHKYERDQLQSQIRGLTGALERESKKDRKIYELSEEIDILKADKDKIINNYDNAIEKLNNDSEESIKQEIDKRVRETAAFKREINDLKQKMHRENNIRNRLEGQVKNLKNDIDNKDGVISQMRNMFMKEKKNAAILEKKLMKSRSKRNILNEKEERVQKQNEEIRKGGGHTRTKSKTLKDVVVETHQDQKTGDTVITLEKTNEQFNILASMTEEDLNDINSDSDDEYVDENKMNSSGVMMDKDEHNQEIALKEAEIESLKEKIKRQNVHEVKIIEEKNEELQSVQQKIGSLQQQMQLQDENFLKQNQMLEFKLKKKENDSKKLFEDLQDLKLAHRKEIRKLNEDMERNKINVIEKDRQIQNLEQNLDMIEEENGRLKENDEIIADYEDEIDEIDQHYQNMLDEIRQQNEETQTQFKDLVDQREQENKDLKKKVHTQTESIAELHSILENMQTAEMQLEDKQARINTILANKQNNNNNPTRNSRQSVELKESDLSYNDNQWRGQAQVDAPQPDSQPQTPTKDNNNASYSRASRESIGNLNGIDLNDYILKEDMTDIVNNKVNEEKEKIKMEHALEIDTVESKLKRRFGQMEEGLKGDIDRLGNDKNQLVNQLNDHRNHVNALQMQLTNAEENKIKLLHSFMKEMDRMRAEIKQLNGIKRNKR